MMKDLFILLAILLINGCGNNTSSESEQNISIDENYSYPITEESIPIEPLFKQINVGFNANGTDFVDENNNTLWVNKIDLMLDSNIESNPKLKKIKDYNSFSFYYVYRYLKNAKFLVFWVTKNWKESWFSVKKIQKVIDLGYIPVFNYWYFGDTLATHFPNESEVEEYYNNVKRLSLFLSKLKGKKLLIFEPEFNKNSVMSNSQNAKKFASIISHAIDLVKLNNDNVLISLCMTDTGSRDENSHFPKCGYENCALGDKYEWSKPDIIYKHLINKLDFISFQEMVGQFSKNPKNRNEAISYTPEEIGIKYLADRIINISKFLHNKYNKPVFLPYIAIASGVWEDYNNDGQVDNNEINGSGWNKYISLTYKNLRKNRKILLENGLFGYAPMMLFDHPKHGKKGNRFFLQNEDYLGIITTGAKAEVDDHRFGNLKPKGDLLLDYIFAPSKEEYEKNVNKNELLCELNNRESCEKIAKLKLKNYYDMSIEKTKKEYNGSAILIPLYSYPNWYDDDYVWKKIINIKKSNPNKKIIAIINPSNGHFTKLNNDFIHGLNDLTKAGIEVEGYVYTKYGNRDKREIFQDLDNWSKFYKLYGIRGIFFDETSTDKDKIEYYISITNYAKSRGFYFNILNPGMTTQQIYADSGIADVIVTYENNYSDFKDNKPVYYNSPTELTSLAFLIYNMEGNKTKELYDFAKEKNFSYFYATEDNDSNPWDSVSKYLDDEVKLIK